MDYYDILNGDNTEKTKNPNLDYNDIMNSRNKNLDINYEKTNFGYDINNTDYLGDQTNFRTAQSFDDARANNQSNFSKTMSGVGRVGVKVLSEVAKMPGMVGGLAIAPFSEDSAVETIFNNAWINTIEDVNEYVNNEYLPVYIKDSVKNGDIIDNLTSIDFWATEGADGVGYIASMFVPGAALKGLGAGRVMMKGATRVAKGLFSKADDAQNALKAVGATEDGMNVLNATIANTFFESGAEAGGAMDNFEASKDVFIDAKLATGMSEEDAEKLFQEEKADLGRNIFWSNVGILIGPNLITNKILYGAKKGMKGVSNYIDDSGKMITGKASGGFKKKAIDYTGEFTKGFAREGFWEEAMQSSVEHKFLQQAETGKEVGLVDSYLHTISTVDGQKAIALGGLLGGPMNVYSKVKEDKATDKKRKELAPHMENMLELFTMNPSDVFTTDPETGKRSIDPKYAVKYAEETKKLEELENFYDNVQAYKDATGGKLPSNIAAIAEAQQNRFTSSMVLPFIMQGEMGVEILKKALENNEAIIEKLNKENELLGTNETKEDRISKIVDQASQMQKDYEKSSEYLKYFTPIKADEENKDQLDSFYKRMNILETLTKQNQRFLELNKNNIEGELSEITLESLKKFQLKKESAKRLYESNKTNDLNSRSKVQVDDLGKKSFSDWMKGFYKYNDNESFLDWYKDQNDGIVYKNKLDEVESISNALLEQYDIMEMLYDKKKLKEAFDYSINTSKAKEQLFEEQTEKIKKQEAEAKENAEKDVIREDNKAKKEQEDKKKAKKKAEVIENVEVNNKLYNYAKGLIDNSTTDSATINLNEDTRKIFAPIKELKNIDKSSMIRFEQLPDGKILVKTMGLNNQTLDRVEVELKEVKKEEPKDTPKPTVSEFSQSDDIASENNEEQSEAINEEEEYQIKDRDAAHAKIVDQVGDFADETFINYSEEPRDKSGEEVTFELGVPGTNQKAQEALDLFNDNGGVLIDEQMDNLYEYLPIQVNVKNGGKSSLFFSNPETNYSVKRYPSIYNLRKNIVDQLLEGKKPKSIIMFQKPGEIQLDRLEGGIPANNSLFDEKGKSNVIGVSDLNKTDILFTDEFGNIVKNNGDPVLELNTTVKNPGSIYVKATMANGRAFPLKLNQRRLNQIEANIIVKIIEEKLTSNNFSYKNNLDSLSENTTFTKEEKDYIVNEFKLLGVRENRITLGSILNNFYFEGNTNKNIFKIEGNVVRYGNDMAYKEDFQSRKEEIKDWLITQKNRQIKKNETSKAGYKKYVFNTILSTDAKLGEPLFQGSTAIYLDPNMGINPVQAKINEKKQKKVEQRKKTPLTSNEALKRIQEDEMLKDAPSTGNDMTPDMLGLNIEFETAPKKKESKPKENKPTTLEKETTPKMKIKNPGKGMSDIAAQMKAMLEAKQNLDDKNCKK